MTTGSLFSSRRARTGLFSGPAVTVALVVGLSGCTAPGSTPVAASPPTTGEPTTTTGAEPPMATAAPAATTTATTVPAPPPTAPTTALVDVAAALGPLLVSDAPAPAGYRRDEWPHWLDIDGDGCDAREQALRSASRTAVLVGAGCQVSVGHWVSDYDGIETDDPSAFDVDHVIPLADAYRSGGNVWSTDQRARFANDQGNLWVVSASSNRSKSDQSPDQWRPPRHEIWCTYATRWLQIKVQWRLTATSSERDAIGRMLETCPGVTPAPTTVPSAPAPAPIPVPTAPAPTSAPATVYYANCAAARSAGAAPLHRGEPGYRDGLDGDKDGIACE